MIEKWFFKLPIRLGLEITNQPTSNLKPSVLNLPRSIKCFFTQPKIFENFKTSKTWSPSWVYIYRPLHSYWDFYICTQKSELKPFNHFVCRKSDENWFMSCEKIMRNLMICYRWYSWYTWHKRRIFGHFWWTVWYFLYCWALGISWYFMKTHRGNR